MLVALTFGGYFLKRNRVHGDPCPGNITSRGVAVGKHRRLREGDVLMFGRCRPKKIMPGEPNQPAILALVAQSVILINIY